MRVEEARTIVRWVGELKLPSGSVCLNIGSSTGEFRKVVQPHIDRELIAPLERIGLRIVHCDLKQAEGVDEVGDLLDPAFRERLRSYDAHLMICSNLLEHLVDPLGFAAACGELVRPGGYGIITVPYSYPYHPDPIDTMLRPTVQELSGMLRGWTMVRGEVIRSGTHWSDLRASGAPFRRLINQTGRTLLPIYRRSQWPHVAHRMLWLTRRFSSSAVLMRKPS